MQKWVDHYVVTRSVANGISPLHRSEALPEVQNGASQRKFSPVHGTGETSDRRPELVRRDSGRLGDAAGEDALLEAVIDLVADLFEDGLLVHGPLPDAVTSVSRFRPRPRQWVPARQTTARDSSGGRRPQGVCGRRRRSTQQGEEAPGGRDRPRRGTGAGSSRTRSAVRRRASSLSTGSPG